MSYAKAVGRRGPKAHRDESGERSARLPLIPVTPGEYEAIMGAAAESEKSYAEWAREILVRAAKRSGAVFPKEVKD